MIRLPADCEPAALPIELQAQGISGTEEIRTLRLLTASQALSQMSYGPINQLFVSRPGAMESLAPTPTPSCTCDFHSALMRRMSALEDAAKLTSELKQTLRHLSDNVAALHQAVVQISAQRSEAMPRSVRWAIWVPSVLVSAVSGIWLLEHAARLIK